MSTFVPGLAHVVSAPWRIVADRLRAVLGQDGPRTVPAAVVGGAELVHLGGGESLPCPGADALPLAPSARGLGLGTPTLALPPARVHVLHDARICVGSRVVVDGRGRTIAEALSTDMVGRVRPRPEELEAEPLRLEGSVGLFRTPWRPYFHTVVDHLPRAALFSQGALAPFGPITLVHDGDLLPVERRLLRRLLPSTVRLRRLDPGTSVVADRILLPGYLTRPAAGAVPSWYRRWLDRELGRIPSPPGGAPRRIFVDRRRGPRRVRNRDALDVVLRRHGITAVEPESMSADDCLATFRDAELVLGVTGSGLANAVFARRASVVELLPGEELLPHFFYLCAAKGLPYTYVAAPPDGEDLSAEERLRRDVNVDVAALDAALERRA